jgi:hypothetical protein
MSRLRNICVANDHGYVPLVVNIFRSFLHSCLINGFVIKVTRRMPLVEQELLTIPQHLSSPPISSVVHVTRSLVLCVIFCRSLFVLLCLIFWPLCCLSFFDLRILISDYPLWYLQSLLRKLSLSHYYNKIPN